MDNPSALDASSTGAVLMDVPLGRADSTEQRLRLSGIAKGFLRAVTKQNSSGELLNPEAASQTEGFYRGFTEIPARLRPQAFETYIALREESPRLDVSSYDVSTDREGFTSLRLQGDPRSTALLAAKVQHLGAIALRDDLSSGQALTLRTT